MKTLTLLCIAMLLGFGSAAQADAPYVYYYSRLLGGWVLERADGTDSRLFAQGIMPPQHQVVRQIGWSPSGEWFAWFSADQFSTVGPTPQEIWLANVDGSRLPLLDGHLGILTAYWSPTSDWLFVVSRNSKHRTMTDEVFLIDAAAGRLVAHFTDLADAFPPDPDSAYWSQDGKDVLFAFNHIEFDAEGNATIGERISRLLRGDGSFVDGLTTADVSPRRPREQQERRNDARSIASSDGLYRVALYDPTLINMATGEHYELRLHSGHTEDRLCRAEWAPDSPWLLRYDAITFAGGGCPSGITVGNAAGTVQRELTVCPLGGDCAGWLPPHVVAHLTPGQTHSVVPEPRLTFSREGDMMGVGWRADSAAFATFEEEYQPDGRVDRHLLIWSFDGESADVMKIIEVDQCFEPLFFNCEIEWSPDGTRIALAGASGVQIVTVENSEIEHSDLSFAGWTEMGEPILVESFIDADYDPTHDRIALIAKQGDQGASVVEVIDRATDEVVYQRVFGPDYNFVDSVNFLPDGSGLVLAVNAEQKIWTFTDDRLMPLADVQEVYMTDSRPHGRYIIGFGRASLTHIFDAATGELVTSLNRYSYDVAVSPDGRYLATAGGQGVSVWDMADVLAS